MGTLIELYKILMRPHIQERLISDKFFGTLVGEENLSGLKVLIYQNCFFFALVKGSLYGKARAFGWPNKMPGIGLSYELLTRATIWQGLVVVYHLEERALYVADPSQLLEQCSGWVIQKTRKGVPIYACPKHMFKVFKVTELPKRQVRQDTIDNY